MHVARLLTIVRVDEEHKLVCQAPGCGRGIYAAVHVIRDETGAVHVVGSDCYLKLMGHEKATEEGPAFGGWDGRRLTEEERNAMLADTAAFVARMEAQFRAEAAEAAAMAAEEADRQRLVESARAARLRARASEPQSRPLSLFDFAPDQVSAAFAAARRHWQAKGVDVHLPGFVGLIEGEALRMLRESAKAARDAGETGPMQGLFDE